MKATNTTFKLIPFFFLTLSALASSLVVSENCRRPLADEPIVYAEEFRGSFNLKSLVEKEQEIYTSGKRLMNRAFEEDGELYLTHSHRGDKVKISLSFVKGVIAQVEKAFVLGYVDALIFPDMGHSHMFIDLDYFKKEVAPHPVAEQHLAYEKMLNHPKSKFLYHTAEKLKFYDDEKNFLPGRKLGWRFHTRNIVGDSQGNIELIKKFKHSHNTAHFNEFYDNKNIKSWSAGFNISGSEKGCFAYSRAGKTMFFDISLLDLPYRDFGYGQPNSGDVE